MEKYRVELSRRAYRDLDEIFSYIEGTLMEPAAADRLMDEIEKAILSLEFMPNRFACRSQGIYANKGYRQMLVKNYIVVYRGDEAGQRVIVATVQYSARNF